MKHSIFLFFILIPALNCTAQRQATINVVEKGVNAIDKGNDADAIQSIINNAKPESTIFFPAGTYLIDKPLEVMSDHLTLKGEQGTIFSFTGQTDYYALYGTRVGILNICASDITVDNLFIDEGFTRLGRRDGDKPMIGGILLGCKYKKMNVRPKNITVSNCTINDYYGDGISAFNIYVSNFTVTGNTLISAYVVGNWKTAGTKGEQAINVQSGDNIRITNNTIKGALDDAIALHLTIKNLTVTGNNITTCGGRILVSGVDSGYIANNHIEYIENGGTAIEAGYSSGAKSFSYNNNVVITGNTIHVDKGVKIVACIRLHGPGTNVLITDNTCESEDKSPAAIHMQDAAAWVQKTDYFGDNITIRNNTFKNFKYGIVNNISEKVQAPKLFIQENRLTDVDKDIEMQYGKGKYQLEQ